MTKTSRVCTVRSTRVNVITFYDEGQQTRCLAQVDYAYPDGGCVGAGRGDFAPVSASRFGVMS